MGEGDQRTPGKHISSIGICCSPPSWEKEFFRTIAKLFRQQASSQKWKQLFCCVILNEKKWNLFLPERSVVRLFGLFCWLLCRVSRVKQFLIKHYCLHRKQFQFAILSCLIISRIWIGGNQKLLVFMAKYSCAWQLTVAEGIVLVDIS